MSISSLSERDGHVSNIDDSILDLEVSPVSTIKLYAVRNPDLSGGTVVRGSGHGNFTLLTSDKFKLPLRH